MFLWKAAIHVPPAKPMAAMAVFENLDCSDRIWQIEPKGLYEFALKNRTFLPEKINFLDLLHTGRSRLLNDSIYGSYSCTYIISAL